MSFVRSTLRTKRDDCIFVRYSVQCIASLARYQLHLFPEVQHRGKLRPSKGWEHKSTTMRGNGLPGESLEFVSAV